jgi:DNA-binding transcriptional LysR family regulator
MLDGVSLDQLRAFIGAVDEGSFSAAARKLHRAQSAVSELVGNLEAQIGVLLFDRSERKTHSRRHSAGGGCAQCCGKR